jgi:hypothetical protein
MIEDNDIPQHKLQGQRIKRFQYVILIRPSLAAPAASGRGSRSSNFFRAEQETLVQYTSAPSRNQTLSLSLRYLMIFTLRAIELALQRCSVKRRG